jgi:hypothetical protein
MRLPGSVAEVQASPPGPEIGAFFDLDGTLVAEKSGLAIDLIRNGLKKLRRTAYHAPFRVHRPEPDWEGV